MKYLFSFLLMMAMGCKLQAQQGVGIGISTPHASALLELSSTTKGLLLPRMNTVQRGAIGAVAGLMVYDTDSKEFYQHDGTGWKKLLNSTFWNSSSTRSWIFNITDSIGIGTSTPDVKFHLYDRLATEVMRIEAEAPLIQLRRRTSVANGFPVTFADVGFIQTSFDNLRIGTNSSNLSGKFVVRVGGSDRMFVDASGNVSIGTTATAAGYIFNVGGKAICEELKVQLKGSWPDYVFEKKYNLMPLDKLETFINTNNHLPNIPKASEVAKEGLEIGEMQRRMMEKIEELTLYIIKLKKEIEDIKLNTLKQNK